ncbi:hypothetical protein EJC51_01265 [Streptomyces aquilus]|uniref:Vegetative cell wall protein gp1 n=1 Tax=Streptomyces aquilus TaxID=2548456 RepID=A0A3S5HME9_9ACTN|nr:hypothetical protein [Streptomyces aquilus]AZP14898.1 hypothetical protein EJC51_01265 [Streptomyces aquilus]
MSGFLGQLGQKLAERWLTLLVLPGALYLASAACARALGQTHPIAVNRLSGHVTAWSHSRTAATTAGQVLVLAGVLAGAAAAGLAAQALGSAIERGVLAADWRQWPFPVRDIAARRTASRRARWDALHEEYSALYRAAGPTGTTVTDEDRDRRLATWHRKTRIAAERPERPTWSGDRINTAAVRLKRDRHLDMGTLWPHLWLTMPETTRTQITDARQDLTRATTLGGWTVLYAALTWWWWPAAVLAGVLTAVARHRIRAATDTYATLLEAAARLHTGELAAALGVSDADSTAESGDVVMSLLRPLPPPLAGD